MGRMVLVYALMVLIFTSVSLATTWYVKDDGTGDAPTIQAGIDSAAAGDTLLLADGVYRGPGNRDVSVNKRLVIRSESNDPEACIIDCEGSLVSLHRGFHISHSADHHSEISGLSVVNGYNYLGGAIWVDPPGADIRNCVFRDNYADLGGGVFVAETGFGGPSLISECVFRGNDGWGGSAVYAWHHHTEVIIERCLFTDNNSEWCTVGVEDELGYILVNLYNCTFVGNSGFYSAVQNRGMEPDCCNLYSCIIAFGTGEGYPLHNEGWVRCSAFYENQPYPDWLPWGTGNFTGCPSFCDRLADPPDLNICSGSPCAPGNHPDGLDCGLIGALGVGCVCGPSATETTTWGGIKSIHR